MTDRPTLVTRTMILDALKDDKFYRAVPEFTTLKPKMQVMGAENGGGCSGCRGRVVAHNIMADFMSTLSVLDNAAIERLKQYYKVDKLMFNAQDPRTGAYTTKIV